MIETLERSMFEGGLLMYPLLLLALIAPLGCIGLYVVLLAIPNKAWARRFGWVNLALGVFLPPLAWAISTLQMRSALNEPHTRLEAVDRATIEFAARGEAMALPWAALLSSPWLVASGLALVCVGLLDHPRFAKKTT